MFESSKVGTVKILFNNFYGQKHADPKNVYHIKGKRQNLLRLSKITKTARNAYAEIND